MKRNRIVFYMISFTLLICGLCISVSAQTYTSIDQASIALREAMKRRETNIEIDIDIQDNFDAPGWENKIKSYRDEIYQNSYKHTGIENEGDYIQFSLIKCGKKAVLRGDFNDKIGEFTFIYSPVYYDDVNKETQATNAVSRLLSSLPLTGKTDAGKAETIYNWITKNVKYDTEEGNIIGVLNKDAYSCYGAVVRKKAVCQGYASLLYRLCNMAGIPCRIISGQAKGSAGTENHVWNAVMVDGAYYLCDVTWDATLIQDNHKMEYFLKSSLANHWPEDDKMSEIHIASRDYDITPIYRLSVVNGTGSGSYESGDIATITAKSVAGQTFTKWTGLNSSDYVSGSSISSTAKIKVTRDMTVTANYEPVQQESVKEYYVSITNGTGSGYYKEGSIATIKASSLKGKKFTAWSGSANFVNGTGAASSTAKIKISNNTSLKANYETITEKYVLTVNNGSGSGTYKDGTVVTIRANEEKGKTFRKWSGSATYTDGTDASSRVAKVKVNKNTAVTALYDQIKKKKYKVTIKNGSGSGKYKKGTIVTIKANKKKGKKFTRWTGNAKFVNGTSAKSSVARIKVTKKTTLKANYKKK